MRKPSPPKTPAAARNYFEATREPLVCLVFLLPLVAAYELGALLLRPAADPERELVAASALLHVLAWFGAAGPWVPGVALLLTLLLWHWASGKSWQIRGWAPLAMLGESVIVAPPLLVLARLMLPTTAAQSTGALKVQIVYTLGAAIYEEMLFRFIFISVLLLVLVDLFRVQKTWAAIIAGGLAALVFAACHMRPIGGEPFEPRQFAFLAISGGYLALLYVTRGLGVCTGCHAAYNIIMLLWR